VPRVNFIESRYSEEPVCETLGFRHRSPCREVHVSGYAPPTLTFGILLAHRDVDRRRLSLRLLLSASQWQDELKRHTPSLKVLFYEGWSKFSSMRSKITATASGSRSTNPHPLRARRVEPIPKRATAPLRRITTRSCARISTNTMYASPRTMF